MEIIRGNRNLCSSPHVLLCENPRSSRIRPLFLRLGAFCSLSSDAKLAVTRTPKSRRVAKASATQLRERWLRSISSPLCDNAGTPPPTTGCVLGIDPDTSGAVALLRFDNGGCSAQVFDAPHLKIMVGKHTRKRLDARSIFHLLQSFGTPPGTVAYIEQSTPFPLDGKQGWWSGGYNYGLWTGILVACGYSVRPVPARVWKDHFGLSGGTSKKDDSRRSASLLFPSVSSMLMKKKDHGKSKAELRPFLLLLMAKIYRCQLVIWVPELLTYEHTCPDLFISCLPWHNLHIRGSRY